MITMFSFWKCNTHFYLDCANVKMPPNITSNTNKCLCCWCSYHREIDKVLLLLDTHRLQSWCHCCPSIEAFSAIHKQTQSLGLDMNPSWAMAWPLMRRPPTFYFLTLCRGILLFYEVRMGNEPSKQRLHIGRLHTLCFRATIIR